MVIVIAASSSKFTSKNAGGSLCTSIATMSNRKSISFPNVFYLIVKEVFVYSCHWYVTLYNARVKKQGKLCFSKEAISCALMWSYGQLNKGKEFFLNALWMRASAISKNFFIALSVHTVFMTKHPGCVKILAHHFYQGKDFLHLNQATSLFFEFFLIGNLLFMVIAVISKVLALKSSTS